MASTVNSQGSELRKTTQNAQGNLPPPPRLIASNVISKTEGPTLPPSSCDIYCRSLLKARGSPLWIPQPNKNSPVTYQRAGIQIGDVGIITSRGNFDFLFNICLPADHPVNREKVPENFVPLYIDPLNTQKLSEFGPRTYVSGTSLRKTHHDGASCNITFDSSASEGAILVVPEGSNSEDLRDAGIFRKYAAQYAVDWYKYATYIWGREPSNGDIRLVIGHDKASSWGMAAFSSSTAQNNSFHLSFRPTDEHKVGRTYRWEYSGMAQVRSGPSPRETQALQNGDPSQKGVIYENQSLFIRTINVKLGTNIWSDLMSVRYGDCAKFGDQGRAPIHNDTNIGSSPTSSSGSHTCRTPSQDNGLSVQSVYLPSSSQALTGHPSDFLNDVLLSFSPDARTAITDDHDWMALLKSDDTIFPTNAELYSRVMSSFCMHEEEGMLYLKKKGAQPAIPHAAPHGYPSQCGWVSQRDVTGFQECMDRKDSAYGAIPTTKQQKSLSTRGHSRLFALIVTINNYKSKRFSALRGAISGVNVYKESF